MYPLESLRLGRRESLRSLLKSSFGGKPAAYSDGHALYCVNLIEFSGSRSIVLSRLNGERVYLLSRKTVNSVANSQGPSGAMWEKEVSTCALQTLEVLYKHTGKLEKAWCLFSEDRLATLCPDLTAPDLDVHLVKMTGLAAKISQLSPPERDALLLWVKSPIATSLDGHPFAKLLLKRFKELSGIIPGNQAKALVLLELCSAMASCGL